MKRILYSICIVFALNILAVSCKVSSASYHNTDEDWSAMDYKTGHKILSSDTAFLMLSNRQFIEGQLRFATTGIDTSQIHILYVARRQNKWEIRELQSLREGIVLFPPGNWVLYTEGMGKLFTANVERAYLMTKMYNVHVILFDYSSITNQKGLKKNYNFSQNNAINSYRQYAAFLEEIGEIRTGSTLFENGAVSIFLHSMGNLTFRKMMTTGLFEQLGHKKFIDNIIFNAACVNRKNHHKWIDEIDFANHIYINYNKKDSKLKGATFLSGNRKLGNKPKHPFAKSAYYMDFQQAVDKNHSYFLNFSDRTFMISEDIKSYYRKILNGVHLNTENEYPKSRIVGNKMKK